VTRGGEIRGDDFIATGVGVPVVAFGDGRRGDEAITRTIALDEHRARSVRSAVENRFASCVQRKEFRRDANRAVNSFGHAKRSGDARRTEQRRTSHLIDAERPRAR